MFKIVFCERIYQLNVKNVNLSNQVVDLGQQLHLKAVLDRSLLTVNFSGISG
jgi:hypothetical protein